MKKLVLLLALGIAAWVGLNHVRASGPEAQAFRAYQEQATAEVMGSHMAGSRAAQRYGGPTTKIESVSFELESSRRVGEEQVEMIVLQTVQFRFRQDGPSRPEFRKSRHEVLMKRDGGRWEVATLSSEHGGRTR